MKNKITYKIEICYSCYGMPNPVTGSPDCTECIDSKTGISTGVTLVPCEVINNDLAQYEK